MRFGARMGYTGVGCTSVGYTSIGYTSIGYTSIGYTSINWGRLILKKRHMQYDYTNITEQPGTPVNDEQWARLHHRYGLALHHAGGRRVLEAACGTGLGLSALRTVADYLTSFDYAQSSFGALRSHQPNSDLVRADAQRLPFAGGSFDVVLCFEAVYYLARPAAFLADARRVLATNGMLLLGTSNPQWPAFVPGALTTHYPSAATLATLLANAGFRSVQLFGAFADEERSQRQQLVLGLRHFVLSHTPLSKLLERQPRLAALLQRASYGALRPLPAAIEAGEARRCFARTPLVPLSPHQAERQHRVLYALAQA